MSLNELQNNIERERSEEQKKALKTLAVKHFRQSAGYCGPASIKILLSHFGKDFSENELAALAGATHEVGTEHEGMVSALKQIGTQVFSKEDGTVSELEYFVNKKNLPVIIGWFDKDGDHYSVVVSVTEKNIVIVDPAVDEPERWLDRETFPKIWFDFVGKDNKIVSWGWYMVVNFENEKYDIVGGQYH